MSSHISSNENLAKNNANDNALVSSEQPLPPDTRLQLELQNINEGYNNGVQPQRYSRILPGGYTTEDKLQLTSSQQEPSQTQMTNEILTQTADLTQFGDEDDDEDDEAAMQRAEQLLSPRMLMPQPWGRLLPCSTTGQILQLYPRSPNYKYTNSSSKGIGSNSQSIGLAAAFLRHVRPQDIFNEYTIGRNTKCDVQAINTTSSPSRGTSVDRKLQSRQEWCYGMISNRHCRIYCTLDAMAIVNSDNNREEDDISSKLASMQVWVEDCSGNGTVINGTTLLQKGDKRLLHSGDEICLVQKQTLQKKIVSRTELQALIHQHSFVFVNCVTTTTSPITNSAISKISSLPSLMANAVTHLLTDAPANNFRRAKRKAAVDVRATKSTRQRPSISQPELYNDETLPLGNDVRIGSASISSQNGTAVPPTRRISPRRQQPRRIQQDYDIRDILGSGTMGEVRRAIHRPTGQTVAVKIISMTRSRSNNITSSSVEIEMEAAILRKLQHPYIVKLMDVYTCPTAVYLVMELVPGGDLFDRIIQKGRYSEVDARRVMRRLLAAVHYLHESSGYGIVHRDLKPENILLSSITSDIDVKLTDFGLAKQDGDLKTFCGTPQYFAPEVLRRRHTVKGCGRYGKQADMWSLGVILYVLLTGTTPFDTEDNSAAIYSSQSNIGEAQSIEFPNDISIAAQDMIRQLLQYDPRKRASVLSACSHQWILQDDGDTHIHPLEDPKLIATPPCLESPYHDAATIHDDDSLPRKPPPTSGEGTISLTDPVGTRIRSPCPCDVPLNVPLTGSSQKVLSSAKNFSFQKDFLSEKNPCMVGNDGNPLMHDVTKIGNHNCENGTPKTPFQHLPIEQYHCKKYLQNRPTNTVTPAFMMTEIPIHTDGGWHGQTYFTHSKCHMDDNKDDDLLSKFTENTESVDSFSTIANDVNFSIIVKGNVPNNDTNMMDPFSNKVKQSKAQSQSKRVRAKNTPSRNVGTPLMTTRSSVTKKSMTQPPPRRMAPPEHPQQHLVEQKKISSGRKQMTLNTWLKKSKS